MTKMNRQLITDVLGVVAKIPLGKVATYGQIAAIVGRPHDARLVGRIMHNASKYGKYPCHRVVTATGRLVPGWLDQRPMLISEGVPFRDSDHVDIKRCRWRG